jgi:hypothetical protein
MAMVGAAAVAASGYGMLYASCDACNNDACLQMVMAGVVAVAAVAAIQLMA